MYVVIHVHVPSFFQSSWIISTYRRTNNGITNTYTFKYKTGLQIDSSNNFLVFGGGVVAT